MSDLLVIAFDDANAAHELEKRLALVRSGAGVDMQDVARVTRDADGRVHMHKPVNAQLAQTVGGGVWGLLLGAAFLVPVAGAVAGAAAGAIIGQGRQPGIDRDFLKEVAEKLHPGGSALCLLAREIDRPAVEAVLAEMPGEGRVIEAELSAEAEAALREKAGKAGEHAGGAG